MSYLRHLDACNRLDPDSFVPLVFDGERVGFIRRDRASALDDYANVFAVTDRAVEMIVATRDSEIITAVLREVSVGLVRRGLVPNLRNEPFAVTRRWGDAALFELDRGAVPFFGTRSYGVHLNGFSGEQLWIGKRALDKKVAPGKLDNLVAGGISSGYDAWTTLVKESGEEAGFDPTEIAVARPAGAIVYRMQVPEGVRDDVLFVYDIQLRAGFEPRNTDGEFDSFSLMGFEEVLRLVRDTDEFKFNVNLVLIDLALRRGAIGPDHPEYLALLTGLRGGLIREARERPDLGG